MGREGLRDSLSFGFEQTFTVPEWWTDPGFVATSDTPLKRKKMRALAESLAGLLGGRPVESLDSYGHFQLEVAGRFVVTMDPGSIEVKTRPCLFDGVAREVEPLFRAAKESGVVPYRDWWYGVRKGTEGGCHVNMGGLSPETNPWVRDPALVLKYAAFYHNRPELHYPFMGVDVGPGGNCMRMDERRPEGRESLRRFRAIAERWSLTRDLSPEGVAAHFRGTKLADDKHGAPSLYKYKAPHYLLEDRAVEAPRSPGELELLCGLRLAALESLRREADIEELRDPGPELHAGELSCELLWSRFRDTCAALGLPPGPYRVFFERQFPRLCAGSCVPRAVEVREGRRPRVITGVVTRGGVEISKTIDTSYGRIELGWVEPPGERRALVLNGMTLEPRRFRLPGGGTACGLVVDYRRPEGPATLDSALFDLGSGRLIEKHRFDPASMMFAEPAFDAGAWVPHAIGRESGPGSGYHDLGRLPGGAPTALPRAS